MTECWRAGRMGHCIGEHFVMPRRVQTGALVYGVWVVRSRNRFYGGTAELLAEFRSKVFANRWCRERNAAKEPKP